MRNRVRSRNETGRGLDVELSDGELLERFNAARDESAEMAFAVLVRRHGLMILRGSSPTAGRSPCCGGRLPGGFLGPGARAAIEKPQLLGNWLYGVALRSAWETRMRDGRRVSTRDHGRRESSQSSLCDESDQLRAHPDLPVRGTLEVLHDEVARLPERYRVPVVLCELEGLTYQEAARRLRCPASDDRSTINSSARERLRCA